MADPEKPADESESRPKRRRKFRRWIILILLLSGLLIWVNGPGLRFIAPRVAVHFLEKAGLRGNFKVTGNLTGGLSLSDLRIEGDKDLASLTIDKIVPDYQWKGLVRGKLEGLTIDGVHADLRLGLKKPDEPEKPPLDLKKLVETLRSVRGQVVPLEIEIKNLSLAATRDGKPALNLAKSGLSHKAGSDDLTISLGAITDAAGREWPAQQPVIRWTPENLSIARVDPFPGVSVRELVVQLPAGEALSADAQVHLGDAVFVISSTPGLASAKIDLREGKLEVGPTLERFGVQLPLSATLTSLAIDLDQILPDPKAATGTAKILLERVAWQDWSAADLSMDATLAADNASVVAHGVALGTGVSLDVTAPITRGEKSFTLGDAQGHFKVEDVAKLLHELAPRVPAIDPEAPVGSPGTELEFAL